MRFPISILLGSALVWIAAPASAQVPGPGAQPPSPGAPVGPPLMAPTISPPPSATVVPPPPGAPSVGVAPPPPGAPNMGVAPPPPGGPSMGVAPSLPPASFPLVSAPPGAPQKVASAPESEPLRMAGRVGFGIGLWGNPVAWITQPSGANAPAATAGTSLGIRWWLTERLVLLPVLVAGISHQETPDTKGDFGEVVKGYSTTSATIAPALRVGYSAYTGKSTRFLLSGGPAFSYSVQPYVSDHYPDGSLKPPTEDIKRINFALLAGMAIEQFFTSRISIVLGVDAPVFSFTSSKQGKDDPTTTVGADFNSTQLNASVFFYTD